jgi:HEAT repeat protein
VRGIVAIACSIVLLVALGLWYYNPARVRKAPPVTEAQQDPNAWLDQLHSQNPRESSEAARSVEQLGARALPAIRATLQNPAAEPQRVKAALKACAILGAAAAPAIADVAAAMPDPTLTTEAAVALSFMGGGAFAPLRASLGSDDPMVRRESLRSIGKLKERAPLESRAVLPLLISGMDDADPGVRAVAATYLGIIHEGGAEAVIALIEGLKDPEPAVRLASATALGSFGADAVPALPALRKAAGDPDEDVAREAGVSLVKLQPGS